MGLVLLAAACGGGEEAGPATVASDPVRVAVYSDILSVDPHFRNELLTTSILANVFEALTGFDAEARLVPSLAESWESPDDLTWRFVLRSGVTFHDGRPLEAEDVVYSLERARRSPRSRFGNYLAAVDTIGVVDSKTVEIVTREPTPVLLNKLAVVLIVPRGTPEVLRQPIGTGPYTLAGHEPEERLMLRAYPGYWRGEAAVDAVDLLTVLDAEARVTALLDGDVELALEIPPEDVDRIENIPGVRVAAQTSLVVEYLHLRVDAPPFDDLRVRRAVHLAVDRRDLVETYLRGQGLPAGQLVGRNVFGYSPEIEPPEPDPEAARALLAEAGYPDGLDLELEMREGRDPSRLLEQLAAVGIRATPEVHDWGELYQRLVAGRVDFYLGGLLSLSIDSSDVFVSKLHTRDPLRHFGDTNFNGYSNPTLDELVAAADNTLDMGERRILLRRAMEVAMEDLPLVPLVGPYDLYGVSDELDWEPRVDGRLDLFSLARR